MTALSATRLETRRASSVQGPWLLHVFLPVLVGAAIYVLFRSRDLRVFDWLRRAGLLPVVDAVRHHATPMRSWLPAAVVFSLPDGLWAYGLTASVRLVWRDTFSAARHFWLLAAVVASLGPELGQRVGIVPGTFDVVDLSVSLAAVCVACIATRSTRSPCAPT